MKNNLDMGAVAMIRSLCAVAMMGVAACQFPRPAVGREDASDRDAIRPDSFVSDAAAADSRADGHRIPVSIAISGVVTQISTSGGGPASGIALVARLTQDDSLVDQTVTAADGTFVLSLPTGGLPVDVYLQVTGSSLVSTQYSFPKPLTADIENRQVTVISPSALNDAAQFSGATEASGDGWLLIQVLDGNSQPVPGATISVAANGSPTGTIRYLHSGFPTESATSTDSGGGAIAFSIAPGTVSVGASSVGATFFTHAVGIKAGVISESTVEE